MLQVLEGLYKSGKARAIGVSNYNTAHLQELLAAAEVKPMVNQVRSLPTNRHVHSLAWHVGGTAAGFVSG
jgi:diketogulonate reductase-like aldo/keto reductase